MIQARNNPVPFILAIDTSCDETSVAVTQGCVALSNVVASQVQLHKEYGGVFPTVAKQAHKENIGPAVRAALQRAHLSWREIDLIAVTQGPGLAPALEVGIAYAKDLAKAHNKPLVPINHIEGHVLSPLVLPRTFKDLPSPLAANAAHDVLAVIVSGKHTDFIAVKKIGHYERLGWTIDDAAGEALDKVGRMLGLGYPAGPVLEEFAKKGDATALQFPLPMTTSGDYNLSFSGLKTFSRNKIEALSAGGLLTQTQIYDFSASFQKAIFRSICYKLNKILQDRKYTEVWLGGGVAANMKLRSMLRITLKPYGLKLRVPYSKKLCGDNAAMIGVVAGVQTIQPKSDLEREPRLKLV